MKLSFKANGSLYFAGHRIAKRLDIRYIKEAIYHNVFTMPTQHLHDDDFLKIGWQVIIGIIGRDKTLWATL